MSNAENRHVPRTLVIGLDGLPYSLLVNYLAKGYLPRLAEILSSGFSLRQMDATIPDVSSTSWTSFMTGANPGEHGIFGFTDLRPGTYQMYFPTCNEIGAPTIWEMLGGYKGEKSSRLYEKYKGTIPGTCAAVVLNLPQTYPARPLNGVISAGFVCPDLKKGTYPESAYQYLESIGYMTDVDSDKAAREPEEFFREVFLSLDRRAQAFGNFLNNTPWDLFIAVITESDRLHHFFFDAALDEGHVFHAEFLAVYRKMDEIIGMLFDRFMEMTNGAGFFMTMSDHGFTVTRKEFHVNAWLKDNGFLCLDKGRQNYDQVMETTKAFAMDPGRIYLNMRDKYVCGSVSDSERDALTAELKCRLEGVRDDDGDCVIKRVLEKKDLYRGRFMDNAPDLVCIPCDGFDIKGGLKKEEIFGRSSLRGMHTRHDAHCILPENTPVPTRLNIEDLAGIILDRHSDRSADITKAGC